MNLKELYTEQENRTKSLVVFGMAAIFQVIVMIWTATHNIPLLMAGIDKDFSFVGPLAAVTGELFAFAMFGSLFFLAGGQRWVALGAYCVMMAVLLVNSVIRYAQIANPELASNYYIALYATFGAPFLIFAVVIVALLLLVELDPLIETLNARRALQQTAHSLKVVTLRGAKAMMIDELGAAEHGETVKAGASALVQGVIGEVAGTLKGLKTTDDGRQTMDDRRQNLPERIAASLNGNGHHGGKSDDPNA